MKHPHNSTHRSGLVCTAAFLASILSLFTLAPRAAADLVWNGGGSTTQATDQDGPGSWDSSTADWDQFSDISVPWSTGVAYIGSGGTAGEITLNSPISVNSIYFRTVASGSYDVAGDANGDVLTIASGSDIQVYPGISASISCPFAGDFNKDNTGMLTINVTTNFAGTNTVSIYSGALVVNGGTTGNNGLGLVTVDSGGTLVVSDNLGGPGHESVANAFVQGNATSGTLASAPTGGSVGSLGGYTMNLAPGGSNAFGILQIDGDDNLLYTDIRFDLDLSTTSAATGTAGANSANDYINFTGNPSGAPNNMVFNLNFIGAQPASGTVMTYTVLNYSGPLPPNGAPTVNVVGGASVTSAVLNTNSNPYTIAVTFGAAAPITPGCPSDITVSDNGSGNGAVVNFSFTPSGGCSAPVVTAIPPSGSLFPDGTTLVSCTATDTCGNTASCSFNVIVTPLNTSNPPPPPITGFTNNNDGSITITYTATAGFTYDVQYSTSLKPASWNTIPAANNTPAITGPVSFTDSNASANAAATGQIYYRVMSP